MSDFDSQYFHDEYVDEPIACEAQTLRTCPRCGAKLFEDMNVCYGCLYDFDHVMPDDLQWLNEPLQGIPGPPQVDEEIWGSLDEVWDTARPIKSQILDFKPQAANGSAKKRKAKEGPVRLKVGDNLEIEACGLTINICSSHAHV